MNCETVFEDRHCCWTKLIIHLIYWNSKHNWMNCWTPRATTTVTRNYVQNLKRLTDFSTWQELSPYMIISIIDGDGHNDGVRWITWVINLKSRVADQSIKWFNEFNLYKLTKIILTPTLAYDHREARTALGVIGSVLQSAPPTIHLWMTGHWSGPGTAAHIFVGLGTSLQIWPRRGVPLSVRTRAWRLIVLSFPVGARTRYFQRIHHLPWLRLNVFVFCKNQTASMTSKQF